MKLANRLIHDCVYIVEGIEMPGGLYYRILSQSGMDCSLGKGFSNMLTLED